MLGNTFYGYDLIALNEVTMLLRLVLATVCGGLLFNFRLLAINSNGRHGSYDRNRSTLKVDGVPLQSQHFAPTESIKSCYQHRHSSLVPRRASNIFCISSAERKTG